MSRVTVVPTEDLVAIAIAAGGDPGQMIYHEDTGELEVPGVQQVNLDSALATVVDRSAPATVAAKTNKIEELGSLCRAAIEGGFVSAALGLGNKWYDSKIEDQLNLIGNAAVGDDTIHPYRDTQNGAKVYNNHTNLQLMEVLKDGRNTKLAHLQTFAVKKSLALAAVTLADLDGIVWS